MNANTLWNRLTGGAFPVIGAGIWAVLPTVFAVAYHLEYRNRG